MITVITPSFEIIRDGRRGYFETMMESIHSQSYRAIEHIVIDGGSSDGTVELLDRYRAKGWIDTLVSEPDSGIYDAMNKWLERAHGDYINIMNTDDFLVGRDYFRKSIEALEASGADFTHADRCIQSREGRSDWIKRGNEREAFFRMPFRHQTMVVRRSVFETIGTFDTSYRIAADYQFVLKMLLAGKKWYYSPEVVLHSLDGWASAHRQKCIEEVSRILYNTYGKEYGLTQSDCEHIYRRDGWLTLLFRILLHVKNPTIRDSLLYSYMQRWR